MPRSKTSLENYLMIDDRASGGQLREMKTLTCVHCNAQVILHPLRNRERKWCSNCDAYVCDTPGCQECNGSYEKKIDALQNEIVRKLIV